MYWWLSIHLPIVDVSFLSPVCTKPNIYTLTWLFSKRYKGLNWNVRFSWAHQTRVWKSPERCAHPQYAARSAVPGPTTPPVSAARTPQERTPRPRFPRTLCHLSAGHHHNLGWKVFWILKATQLEHAGPLQWPCVRACVWWCWWCVGVCGCVWASAGVCVCRKHLPKTQWLGTC